MWVSYDVIRNWNRFYPEIKSYIENEPRKKRGRGIGKIIGGLFLIIISLPVFGVGFLIYNVQTGNIIDCNTSTVQFSQHSPEANDICNNTYKYMAFAGTLIFSGIVTTIIGLLVIAFGIRERSG